MIVNMSRITIVGLMSERSALIKDLMKTEAVELTVAKMSETDRERALALADFDDASRRIAEIDEELRKIKNAISFINDSVGVGKKRIAKRTFSYDAFIDPETYKGTWKKVFAANNIQKNIAAARANRASLISANEYLSLWNNLKIPVEFDGTNTTNILIGTIPSGVDVDELLAELDQIGGVYADLLRTDSDQSYFCFTIHKSICEEAETVLRQAGFSKAGFASMKGTPSDNAARIDAEISDVEKEIKRLETAAAELLEDLPDVELLYDYLYNMQQRRYVRSNFLKTDKAFVVGGWVPTDKAKEVSQRIEGRYTAMVETTAPEDGEETPVLLKNNPIVQPFEMITEMFSLPASTGIDPNAIMSVFYWLFFGLMLGDAVYGILLTLACFFILRKMQPEKGSTMGKLLKMFALCGISTILWGALLGSWLADLLPSAFNITVKPLWFDPNADPMRLLVCSLALGMIQIFVGMGAKAYMLIREGKWLSAIFDIGFWYLVLGGAVSLFLGGTAAEIGKITAMVGAFGLILTQGRHQKNILMKLCTGIMSLYDIVGYFSDVLSYSRLLALGLASGIVGQVMNLLAMTSGGLTSIVSTVAFVIILMIGHIFNMVINILGSYVHASRLQYVEFFGRFYESGGKAFRPLRATVKYIKLVN